MERAWSKMTKDFAGVILDPNGEMLQPDQDEEGNSDGKINKTFLKKTLETVNDIVHDYTFDGYEWQSAVVYPDSKYISIEGKNFNNRKYEDHEAVKAFYGLNLSNRRINQLKNEDTIYKKEAKFFAAHVDSRKHALIFSRCSAKPCKSCAEFRQNHPLQKNFHKMLGLPRRTQNGALFMVPEEDPNHPGRLIHCFISY